MTSNSHGTRYHVILPNSAGTAALVCLSESRASLPTWDVGDRPYWQEAPAVIEGVWRLLGLRVAMLRACKRDWSDELWNSYYVVESLEPDWTPPDGSIWVGADSIDGYEWCSPADQTVLREWLLERPGDKRVGWYRPGWFASTERWIDAALGRAGLVRRGEIEQLRSWERSSIMRCESDAGTLYCKAIARQWGHEPALTQWLARRFPDVMPEVLAADPLSGRLLVREFPGQPLPETDRIERWIDAYATLGRVQRELTSCVAELGSLGVPCRSLEEIEYGIPVVLADRRRMRAGMDRGLSEGEIHALQSSKGLLVDACRRLADGPIPLSLDHGDFWPGNIFTSEERVTLFDWSDATITHPFFSLVMAADEIRDSLPDQPDAAERVIGAYLREWGDFGTINELRALFEDAMLVAPLHLALMYRNVYLPAMEFTDELDRMTPHFLRWLVGRVSGE